MRHQDALDQLARETRRARGRLALERALRAGFILLAAMALWAFIALLGAHEALPLLLQSLTALTALLAFVWLGYRARQAWQAPTEEEARARLAADSKFDAGVFETLRDQPTKYDAFAMALWQRERERAIERVERVRVGPPRARLDDLDPYKLRYVLAVALIAAAVFAGINAPDRLARAFIPDPGPLLGDQPMAIEAWAAPAEYTGAAPISLSDLVGQRVETPPSVEVTVRLTGPTGAPRLKFDGGGVREDVRFTRAADGAWEARMTIPGAGRLRIVRFHTRAYWRIAPAPDNAPSAAFTAPISTLPDEHVSISWRARDDFGVQRMVLRVRPVNPPEGLVRADPIDTDLESPTGAPVEAESETTLDLAAHAYAGMEVEARVVAIDALGQEGASEPMRFTLPEKVFLQPLARAAIEIRRHILAERRPYQPAREQARRTIPAGDILLGNQRIEIRDRDRTPSLQRAPEGVRRAARLIDALTMEPRDGYFRDLAVFLGYRAARAQLATAGEIDDTATAADTLWRTALRAEYGGAADAERAMLAAYMALLEAIRDNAPPDRIRQLTDALQRASERYMDALVQEALRQGNIRTDDDTEEQVTISQQDLDEMLEEVRRLAQQGDMQGAAAMLAMHAMIMNNLQASVDQASNGDGEQSQQMQESMDALSQQMGEQRALRDETRQEQQRGQGGSGGQQQGGQGGDDLAQRQGEIRQGLAEAQRMAEESGAAPSEALNNAGEAMGRAEDALRRGDLEGAQAAQSAALENLREGAEALASEMRQRGEGEQAGGDEGDGATDADPLGRSTGRNDSTIGEGVGNSDPTSTRAIYDEIRRRAQDPNRPEAEREYLRRLLDRFGDS
jgi:hypothetical protein